MGRQRNFAIFRPADGSMPALGLDRSGRSLDIGFVEVIRWRDGKAEHSWPIMDHAELGNQLGLGQ